MLAGLPPTDGYVAGRAGWQFLKHEDAILAQHRGIDRFTPGELDSWIDVMEQRQQEVESYGGAFAVLIAPNQQTIYADHMPGWAAPVAPTRLEQLVARLSDRSSTLLLIDPRDAMARARERGQVLYSRTDSHWNALGAFVGYEQLMLALRTKCPDLRVLALADFNLTMSRVAYAMPPNTDLEPFLSLRGDTIADTGPTAIVYGDSFAGPMIEMMKPSFQSIDFVHRTLAYPVQQIREDRPSVVVVELAERMLVHRLH